MENPYARRPTSAPRPEDDQRDVGRGQVPGRTPDTPSGRTPDKDPGLGDGPRARRRRPQVRKPAGQPPVADAETIRRASRFTTRFALFVLAGLLTMNLPVPWLVGSLAFTLGAIVVGYRALRFAWRSGLREQMAPLLMFGLTFTMLIGMSTSGRLAMWPVEVDHQECLGRAVTISANELCEADYQDALKERLADLTRLP